MFQKFFSSLIAVVFSLLVVPVLLAAQHQQVVIAYGVRKQSLPVTIVYPNHYDKQRRYPVIFTLPPGAGNAAMVDVNLALWEEQAKQRGYLIVAPQIYGLSLQSDADQTVPAIFNWMEKYLNYDTARVTITGQSNGGIGVFYAVLAEPRRFNKILVLPGFYQGNIRDLGALKGKSVLMFVGGNDPQWRRQSSETLKALQYIGAKTKLIVLPGQRHILSIDPGVLMDWVKRKP